MQSKIDFTAWFVMQGTIAAMHRPELQSPSNKMMLDFMLPLSAQASSMRFISRFISSLPYTWQYHIGDFVTNNGRLRHFYLRKQTIEKYTREFLHAYNIEQIVILGAGMDVLAMRLAPEFPNIQFIEIDRNESQQFKLETFKNYHIIIPKNLECFNGDLREPLVDILQPSKFKADRKTLWIAEGLFMFLPESGVIHILQQIKNISPAESPVIFTTLPAFKHSGVLGYILQKLYMSKKEKCPYLWAIPFEKIKDFIVNLELNLIINISYKDLHKNFLKFSKDNNCVGENIHVAIT